MINKKILTVASVIAALSTSSAFAKTEGNYVGLNVIRTSADSKIDGDKYKDNQIGFGVDYKYAINFNNVFIAPGVFLERNDVSKKKTNTYTSSSDTQQISTKYRHGIKADIGYDVMDNFAVYFTNGLAENSFEYRDYYKSSAFTDSGQKSGYKLGYFYGLGAAYNIAKDISVNAEYNRQNLDYKLASYSSSIKTSIDVAKIGVAYHF